MTRKIIAVLTVIVLCFCLFGCNSNKTTEPEQTTEPETTKAPVMVYPEGPILYKATDADGDAVWLFGSIHVGKPDFYPLPDYITQAFGESEALAVEVNINEVDTAASLMTTAKLIYKDFTKIDDHIDAETYSKAVQYLTDAGLYSSMLDFCKPVLWSSMIELIMAEKAGADTTLGIDMHLLTEADKAGKEILEIETAVSQTDMLASFSDELQEYMLWSTLALAEQGDETAEGFDELMNLWQSGDEAAFDTYLAGGDTSSMSEEEKRLNDEYNKKMLTDRNILMADFAEGILEEGRTVFICVGAAHVIGEGGIADLLSERGYTVERAGGVLTYL